MYIDRNEKNVGLVSVICRLVAAIAIVSALCGCVGMTLGARKHLFTTENGNTLRIARYACHVTAAEYRNYLPTATHQQAFKFVATDVTGLPLRQWTAYCGATPAQGYSDCLVHEDLGTGFATTPFLCMEYKRFALAE